MPERKDALFRRDQLAAKVESGAFVAKRGPYSG